MTPERPGGLPGLETVDTLPDTALPATALHLAALMARVAARMGNGHDTAPPPPDQLLTIDEAAARLAVTPDWLRRRSALPFVTKLSDGVVRYSARGLEQFIRQHIGRTIACQKCSPYGTDRHHGSRREG